MMENPRQFDVPYKNRESNQNTSYSNSEQIIKLESYKKPGKISTDINIFNDSSNVETHDNYYTGEAKSREETKTMPDSNDFMKYIDLLDRDRRDMESRFREDKRDMELRLSENQKESEKRLLEHFKDQEEKYIQSVKSLNEKFDNLSSKFDDVKKENDDIPNKFNSQRKWLIGILLTCAGIGIAFAIGYTQILLQVLSLIPKK